MEISTWYVYLDEREEWLAGMMKHQTSVSIKEAREFHSEKEAEVIAEEFGGMVLGWCQ